MTDAAAVDDRVVTGEAKGGRFDLAVSEVAGISRAHAQRLIGDGRALVDGRRGRASDRLRGGETLRVELSAPADPTLQGESIELAIAYEDASMLIVDKPAGLVVHPSHGHATGTLVHALVGRAEARGERLGSIAGVGRPGIVHRLDKQTSGLIVVAKTDEAQASLMEQFGARTIEKEYLALVRGEMPSPRGRIEAPVGRDPRDRQRMAVVAGGRSARTRYEVLEALRGHTLLRCDLDTGRTHQIRVHLAAFGHPIAGDRVYGGGAAAPRPMLHAWRLKLRHPRTGEAMSFEAPPPEDFRTFLEAQR